MSRRSLLEQVDRTPLTFVVLVAYLTLGVLTLRGGSGVHVRLGACVPALVADGEPWRLLSHAFVHGGILHLLFNTVGLMFLGPALEAGTGSIRFAAIYLVSAAAGGIAGCLWQFPLAPLVGGSGALFGMMGAAVALNMRRGRHLLEFLDYYGPRQLLGLIVVNLVLGFVLPMISNAAHLGGLLAGFVLTFCFLEPGRHGTDRIGRLYQAGWALLLATTLLYCCRPVARWDYLLGRLVRSTTTAEAEAALAALQIADGAPFTLLPTSAEALREELRRRDDFGPLLGGLLQRWRR